MVNEEKKATALMGIVLETRSKTVKLAPVIFLFFALITVLLAANIQNTEASESASSPRVAVKMAASSNRAKIVGNQDTKRYHLPGMPYYHKVKAHHRVFFDSEQQAIDRGYYKAGTGKDISAPAVLVHPQSDASANIAMQKARLYTKQGKFKEALITLYPYCANPDAYPPVYSDYLVILIWAGQAQEAIRRFEKLPAAFPRRVYLLRNMAKACLDQGDPVKARALYGEVLAQHPDDLTAREGMAAAQVRIYADQGKFDEALTALSPYRNDPAKYPAFYADYLVILIWAGQAQEAIRRFEKLPAAFPKSIYLLSNMAKACLDQGYPVKARALYGEVLAQHPDDLTAREGMAAAQVRIYADQGKFDEALTALSPYRNDPAKYPAFYADYLVILIWAGQAQEAIRRFEKLPAAFPKSIYLLRNMAKACLDQGDPVKARALYGEVLAQHPDDLTALEGMVAALIAQNDWNGVVKVLATAEKTNKHSVQFDLLKAKVLLIGGHYKQALDLYDAIIQNWPEKKSQITKIRDDLIAGLSADQQEKLISSLKQLSSGGEPRAVQYYLLCLVLCHRYQEAVDLMEGGAMDTTTAPIDQRYWYAWAYFKAGFPREAEKAFDAILSRDKNHLPVCIGRIYCYVDQGKFSQAQDMLDKLTAVHGNTGELAYVRAFLFEKQNRLWDAVRVYDGILEQTPNDLTAQRQRLRALSDLGATALATGQAAKAIPTDEPFQDLFIGDSGTDHLYWDESQQAVQSLSALVEKTGNHRYIFDYIVALTRNRQYSRSVELYEKVVASGVKPPHWVKQTAAEAYMAEQKPEQALALYDKILADQPDVNAASTGKSDTLPTLSPWEKADDRKAAIKAAQAASMGRFNALQTLRRWNEAEDQLATFKASQPDMVVLKGKNQPNPVLLELALAQAWYLASQNRLDEANSAFEELYYQTPANLDVRNGLAYMYLWRGWPRRALQAFNIIDNMDETYLPSQTGRAMTFNRLAEKKRARNMTDTLLKLRPGDKDVIQTHRELTVEQMRIWRTEIYGQREDTDSYDTRIRTELSTPLSLKTRLFSYLLWRRTSSGGNGSAEDPAYFKRIGLGLDAIINSNWRVQPTVSVNYDDGQDAGAALRVDYTPTDVWSFGVYGDTHATDVAMRARAAGINASLVGADVTWRQSEWRQAGIGYRHSLFSDDNVRHVLGAGYQQNLWVKNDWRMRVFTDLSATWNSKGNETIYFNPSQAWGLSFTHMTEQTVWKFYQRSFLHRLYAMVGNYQQREYHGDVICSLRYEQEHNFSDRHVLVGSIGGGRNVYDGDAVNDVSFNLVYQWRF